MAVTSSAVVHSHSAHDEAVCGPTISFPLRVPFGALTHVFNDGSVERLLQLEDDSYYATVINRPPRLRAPT
jgi:hypothetical protein